MLTDNYFLKCSELSTITKYWNSLLEFCFGEMQPVLSDTLSIGIKSLKISYNLNLSMIADNEGGSIKAALGEFASTEGKLYRDKLKLVLAS
ncbi:unnamed protein product [Rhizopus stolonifer]